MEGRFGYEGLNSYRPYRAMRSGDPETSEHVPPNVIAALEAIGDVHGVGAAYVLVGSASQAKRELAKLAPTPAVLADLALLALSEGRPGDAVQILDAAEQREQHPAVLWNRAVALQALELYLLSAESFDAVAALGEAGWASEARERAVALRKRVFGPQEQLAAAFAEGSQFALGGSVLGDDFVARAPGVARLYFYEALRLAESRERLEAMVPLAQSLDAFYGEDTLASYITSSSQMLAKRKPMRARYRAFVAGETMSAEHGEALLAEARAANDPLMVIGIMLHTALPSRTIASERLEEFRRATRAVDDPWFRLLAAEHLAQDRIAAEDYFGIHAAIAEVLPLCEQATAIDFRCMRIESAAAVGYAALHQIAEARQALQSGWRRSRKIGFTPYQVRFLQQMADLNIIADRVAGSHASLARAYLQEALLRYGDCHGKVYAHGALAELLISQNRAGASEHMLAIAKLETDGCQAPMTLARALVLAHLGQLGDAVEVLRRQTLSPGQAALADHIEGRAWLHGNSEAGRERLRRSIARANDVEGRDIYARKARAYSYSVLALDAGKLGNYDEALEILTEELGAEPPSTCAVGVVEEETLVAVVRGFDGRTLGRHVHFEGASTPAAKVLDAPMVASLQGCAIVDVFARPPHFGSPELLPTSLAWRYRLRGELRPTSTATPKRIVVSDVDAPKELGLAALKAQERDDAFHLRGAKATPRRVLQAITAATSIEFHVHGLVEASDSGTASLILSPDPDGTFALSSEAIRAHPLQGSPVVFLASCHGGASATLLQERESLMTAFLESGARAVIASAGAMPDTAASSFFTSIVERIEAGETAAAALREERAKWSKHAAAAWIDQLVVFE